MDRLMIYRGLEKDPVFHAITGMLPFFGEAAGGARDAGDAEAAGGVGVAGGADPGAGVFRDRFMACAGELISRCALLGLEGNLWHSYLAYLIASDENAYSLACERRGDAGGSVAKIALHDFCQLFGLFRIDFGEAADRAGIPCLGALTAYEGDGSGGSAFSRRVREAIQDLAARLGRAGDARKFQREAAAFYGEYGVGDIGLHKAFRVEQGERGARISPIANIANVSLDDLIGYESAKRKLIENTEAFVDGRKANNCLLFGDAGTGKSTSIKALVNRYYGRGLRMVEIYKHQFQDFSRILSQLKSRNYRFILYMDDLSFEEFEIEYKYLKAVMEGGLERRPDNVLIYATSNRRHLVREKYSDKMEQDNEMHTRDTVQEKLSLASRFGVTIYFGSPDKEEYHAIVRGLAEKNHILMEEGELLQEADRWELGHKGRSGRAAQQFIDYLLGRPGSRA